jgi:hypothetical protein
MCNRNSEYGCVRDSVRGIVFLGTPHRGADLASLLSTLLWAAFSRRIYVDDLKKNGSLISLINDHFVQVAKNKSLDIVSFWESEDTLLKKVLVLWLFVLTQWLPYSARVVPRDSAWMGFEELVALDGDHNMIVKYPNKTGNYAVVRDQLRTMIEKNAISRSNTLYEHYPSIRF